ncbi:hypothetical protein [Pseudonocardia phyllosphaerae]|uniref:hypothetical protein n=1 Tax=Pseudonocardia phyllosphaerae TaxID=3390502 RepID=UPI00397B27A4
MANPNQPRDSKGRWTKSPWPIAWTFVLAIAVAAGGGGVGAATAGSSLSSGASSSGSSSAGSGKSSSARSGKSNSARSERARSARDRQQSALVRRLARDARVVRRLDASAGTDCAAVSYGRARTFFRTHPCESVVRLLVEVREGAARAYVAVAVVEMPTTDDAEAWQSLVDTHGTGNIRELRTPRPVHWTGRWYRSDRDGRIVTNAQAEPVVPGGAAGRLAAAAAAAADAVTG